MAPLGLLMDWMNAAQSLEEELFVERQCRSILGSKDLEEIQNLCVALLRQDYSQERLLSQAVGKIAEMDAQLSCLE